LSSIIHSLVQFVSTSGIRAFLPAGPTVWNL